MYGAELRYTALQNWKGRLVYTLLGEIHSGYRLRFRVNRRAAHLQTVGGVTSRILELGSANGAFAFWLSRNPNYTVIGLERDEVLVRDCEQIRTRLSRKNLYFVCADVTAPYPLKEKFDLIFASHVFEHLQDDQAALSKAYVHLNAGGRLIIQVPFGDPCRPPSPEAVCIGHMRDGYTASDLRGKAEVAGLEVIFVGGCIGRAGRWAWQLGHRLGVVSSPVSLDVLFFPMTALLIGVESMAAVFRQSPPSPQGNLLMVARRPLTAR